MQRALPVEGAGDHLITGGLANQLGLAGDHRFIDRARPFLDETIGGNARTGPDQQQIATFHCRDRDFPGVAVLIQPHGGIR